MRQSTSTIITTIILVAALGACDSSSPIDAGGTDDAGTDDAGTDDAGTGDAGTGDAGTDDAGTDDAGTDTTTDILLAPHMGGGEAGLGAWGALSADGSMALDVVYTAGGFEWSRTDDPEHAGFVYSQADDAFYSVLSGAGAAGHGVVIKLDATTQTLTRLVELPRLMVDDNTPLGSYVRRPVLSPDGKSLLIVASSGGTGEICPQCGTRTDGSPIRVGSSGGLVHLNLDTASADYLTATAVFSFSGVGATTQQRLYNINPEVVLGRDAENTRDVLFVIEEGVKFGPESGPFTVAAGSAFFLTPGDPADWAEPWMLTGRSETIPTEGTGQLVLQPSYDPDSRTFAWAVRDVTCAGTSCSSSEIFAYTSDTNTTSLPKIINISASDCYAPQVSFFVSGSRPQLICGGLGSPSDFPDGAARWFDVSRMGPVTLRRTFSSWYVDDPVSEAVRRPMAMSLDSASSMFINASARILSINEDLGFLPSQIAELNIGDTSLFTPVMGSADNGWLFLGPPAVGGAVTEPIEDRYVVQLTRGGGDHGFGTVLTYDRLDREARAIPVGLTDVGYPLGQPHVLRDGRVLGTSRFVNAGGPLTERERYVELGLYALDANLGAGAPSVITLPDYSSDDFSGAVSHASRDVGFEEVGDTLWAVTFGRVSPVASSDPGDAALLYALDPTTGVPTGEVHAFGSESEQDFSPSSWVSGLEARDNTLFFLAPLQEDEVTGADQQGHRAWCVDLALRDGTTPRSGFVLLDQLSDGASGGLWSPTGGATLSSDDDELYLLTTRNGASEQGALLQVKVSDCLSTGPSFTTTIADLGVIPSTELFDASDGSMYFGTEDGKLMRFSPADGTVSEAADFAAATGSSRIAGYLSEDASGIVFGVVVDVDVAGNPVARRLFSLRLADGSTSVFDASSAFHYADPMPGVVPMSVER